MFFYYNAHPYQYDVDDCVKRAITVTTGMDYKEVQRGLNRHKKITGAEKFNSDNNPNSYVENILGFKRTAAPKKSDGSRMSVDEFCQAFPKGRFIVSVRGHWSAVINGNLLDTWDCGKKELLAYYAVTPLRAPDSIPIRYGFIIRQDTSTTASVCFYDGNGSCFTKIINAKHVDGYRACLLDMGKHEAIDWSEERWK
ncbi:MAG: hypothetical protein J6L85_01640 [Clostridia bacterium]|nr:hypothetical protein [Clostridia bacterium]